MIAIQNGTPDLRHTQDGQHNPYPVQHMLSQFDLEPKRKSQEPSTVLPVEELSIVDSVLSWTRPFLSPDVGSRKGAVVAEHLKQYC